MIDWLSGSLKHPPAVSFEAWCWGRYPMRHYDLRGRHLPCHTARTYYYLGRRNESTVPSTRERYIERMVRT
jgi:hypothetical protein